LAATALAALCWTCGESAAAPDVQVSRIDIEPVAPTISSGAIVTLVARAFDVAGTELPPQRVFWSSENSTIATVSQGGVVSGQSPGNVQVAASAGGISGIATVSVTARTSAVPVAQVRVTPTSASVAEGDFVQLTATPLDASGGPLSGRVVMWGSSNQSVAIVSSTGRVHGVSPGTVTITAASEGKSGTSQIAITAAAGAAAVGSVVLSVSPDSVLAGGSLAGTATVRDGASKPLGGRSVTLTSSATGVATVAPASAASDGSGQVAFTITAVAPGTARITATSGGRNDTFDVRVLAPVQTVSVTPLTRTVDVGKTTTLTVTARRSGGAVLAGRICTITSSSTSIARVSPGSGVTNSSGEIRVTVTGIAIGLATVTATCEGKSAGAVVTVVDS
jgi:uncharacterized protein YjdB